MLRDHTRLSPYLRWTDHKYLELLWPNGEDNGRMVYDTFLGS